MVKDKEYIIEDLMKSVEQQLKEIHAEDLHADFPVDTGKKVQDEIISKERESLDIDTRPAFNGFVELRVSDNDMVATADFYPPSEGGKVIEEDDVRDRLEVLDIVCGVDWDTIRGMIDQCNSQRIRINDIVIARGEDPVDEIPRHLVIEEHLREKPVTKEEGISVDYREVVSYVHVKKG